jgi:hypothetical protein
MSAMPSGAWEPRPRRRQWEIDFRAWAGRATYPTVDRADAAWPAARSPRPSSGRIRLSSTLNIAPRRRRPFLLSRRKPAHARTKGIRRTSDTAPARTRPCRYGTCG